MESRKDDPSAVMPEASERLLSQSTRVLRLARELALSADASTIARLVARHVGELSGGGPTSVYLLDPEGIPVPAAAAGLDPRQTLAAPQLVARALAEARLVSCGEAVAAPIAAGGEVFGALVVGVVGGAALGIHPSLLVTATELAGAALANARRLAETHAEARPDPLTELGNHRAV